jgi:hypothetical protein
MKIVLIELVGSHGGTLDSRSVNIPEGLIDNGESLIKAAMLEFVQQLVLNPGDTLRVSEYQ